MTNSRILYNVTIKVGNSVAKDWLKWMTTKHIPDVMATEKFSNYQLNRIMHDEPDGVTFAIQYTCESMEIFESYQAHHAVRLQQEHTERYQDKYVAIRTLMEIIDPK